MTVSITGENSDANNVAGTKYNNILQISNIITDDGTFEKLTLKNVVGLQKNLPYTLELSNYVDLTNRPLGAPIPSTPDILYNKNVDVFERPPVRQPDPNNVFGTDLYQNLEMIT